MKKITSVGTILFLLSANGIHASSNLNNYKEQLSQKQDQIQSLQNQVNNLNQNKDVTVSKIAQIESQITSIQNQIDIEKNKLVKLGNEKKEKEIELEKLRVDYEENLKLFKIQFKDSYMSQYKRDYSKAIFDTKSITDFIILNTYEKYILTDKDKKIKELDDNMKKQETLILEIEENIQESEFLNRSLAEKRSILEKEQENYQNAISSILDDTYELSRLIDSNNKDAEAIKAQIDQLQNELYQNNTNNNNASSNTENSQTGYVWPTKSRRVTSPYGYRIHPILNTKKFHSGIDIADSTGSSIYSTKSGTVIYADWRSGYGKTIIIDHGSHVSSLYGHLSSINVSVGQKVSTGQLIGRMGSTGMSTGSHLHFELRNSSGTTDPLSKIK